MLELTFLWGNVCRHCAFDMVYFQTFRVAEEKKELLKGAKAKKGVEEVKGGNATIEKVS